MNFRHLEVFYAVMVNGTVTAAARQLGVSQPSVTSTLQQAEARLGVQLFQRQGGRLVPTDEAHLLFEEAARAHDALAAVAIMAKGLELGRGGHVRIAAVPTIGLELLPNAIELFEGRHMGFQYSVATLNTEEIETQLDSRKGTFNLGFAFEMPKDSPLAMTKIGSVNVRAAVPASWAMPDKAELTIEELADRPYVAGFDHTALGIESQRLFAAAEREQNIVARCHTHFLAGALVQRGLGFALLDNLTIRALQQGDRADTFSVHSIKGAEPLPIMAVYQSERRISNAASVFIECFEEAFRGLVARARHA